MEDRYGDQRLKSKQRQKDREYMASLGRCAFKSVCVCETERETFYLLIIIIIIIYSSFVHYILATADFLPI